MLKNSFLALAVALSVASSSQAATIVWGAQQDNGLSTFGGAELSQTQGFIRLGFFNLSDAAILAAFNTGDLSALANAFTEFGFGRIGDGLGVPSNFAEQTTANAEALGLVGKQIYFWAFRSTDITSSSTAVNTALESGIFYFDKSLNSAWTFPPEGPPPGSTSVDLTNLTNAAGTDLLAGAHVVVGDFPNGSSSAAGAPNFGLSPVIPEPSAALLLGMGALGIIARRRRNS
jgi:hypothetical protein